MNDPEPGLLAAIYAAPEDDSPREVYADWLIERGDPRGEFIALQLRGVASERTRELAEAHAHDWLGSLAPYLASPTFERGFPVSGSLRGTSTPPPDPAWATFREIDGGIPATDEYPMPLLRRARDVDQVALARLEALDVLPPLEELGVWADWRGDTLMARLRLRTLALDARREISPANTTWPWTDLEVLRLRTSARSFPAWFAAGCTSRVRELVLSEGASELIARWDTARLARLEVTANAREFMRQVIPVIEVLERQPPESIVALELHAETNGWIPGLRNRMLAALELHPAIDLVQVAFLLT